ncbi:hypothetical protein [Thermogemmatispora onikobensis]|uniref:hypothetical protein n=1 Tax=Thermogemmatispora onikobensis TaxID=732234 RepID=UPI00159F0372|nr:hypothetical protein [Thermogemmatispora onikobensis]
MDNGNLTLLRSTRPGIGRAAQHSGQSRRQQVMLIEPAVRSIRHDLRLDCP